MKGTPPKKEKTKEPQENNAGREVPQLLKQAFDVFAQASQQLERSYEELKVRADRLARELAQANEELQRQLVEKERISNFLNNILESVTSGILVVTPDGKVALTNKSAERMLDFKADNVEGRHYSKTLKKSAVTTFLSDCFKKDGGASRSREVEVLKSDGRHHYALAYAPVEDASGQRVGSLLVVQDVTRLKRLEEQALRSERLAAMGEVAAELAHEIRNPLGSIELFASLLSRDLTEESNRKLAENIVVGVKSLNAVVSNMLNFTRSIEVHPELLDISELVRETFTFLGQVLAAQGIELKLDLKEDLPNVEADAELIKQVLLNLTQNAVNSMEKGGSLTVSTAGSDDDQEEEAIVLRVSDTGCGIEADLLPRIFDPFFSTMKGGTGLGLSVASQIVDRHGGIISAESKLGKGTTMTFTLPLQQK